jgi:hypothetical protein
MPESLGVGTAAGAPRPLWEYFTVTERAFPTLALFLGCVDVLGEQGWEMCGSGYCAHFFKRSLPDGAPYPWDVWKPADGAAATGAAKH